MTEKKKNFAHWFMGESCNFNCKYCFFPQKTVSIEEHLPVEQLIKALKETGKKWIVLMTGGEPLIFPDFVEVCKLLVKEDIKIALDTNLSINSKVGEFMDNICPQSVDYLYISLHIEERERMGGIEDFIQSVLSLKSKGYRCIVNYVVHPTLIKRFRVDYEYFKSRGIKLVARLFIGMHKKKRYPDSYSQKEMEIIKMYTPDAFSEYPFYSKGIRCNAGKSSIRIDKDGAVLRCRTDITKLGNIFEGIKLNNGAEPCVVGRCPSYCVDLIQDPNVFKEANLELS
jgi:MoaA/NifB/PqqE/SkfB family radical SAM enzyme